MDVCGIKDCSACIPDVSHEEVRSDPTPVRTPPRPLTACADSSKVRAAVHGALNPQLLAQLEVRCGAGGDD